MPDPLDYTVGWICALAIEFVAAQAFLSEAHGKPEQVSANDANTYALGKIGKHHVVIAVMPDGGYGTSSATAVATHMLHSFPNVRIGLMVGIGGGAPSAKNDIRLGDIVVSSPKGARGGVLQYDFVKTEQNQSFELIGFLNQPPTVLRTAVSGLKAKYDMQGHSLEEDVEKALGNIKRHQKYRRPPPTADRLFLSSFTHPQRSSEPCRKVCNQSSQLQTRRARGEDEDNLAVHYGLIASGNRLVKDAVFRDRLAAAEDVLCFEMEAAGLINTFPCLVIRGICDYSDTHKNDEWQGFAAMMAAAYATDLLSEVHPSVLERQTTISQVLGSVSEQLSEANIALRQLKTRDRDNQIKEWIFPLDVSVRLNESRHTRQKNSGLWFLQSTAFDEWERGLRRNLWVYGITGCGKTVLSSIIFDKLKKRPNTAILAFTFDSTSTNKQTWEIMLRALIYQLYLQEPRSVGVLESLFQSHQRDQTQTHAKELSKTLEIMIQGSRDIFLVLDALDECWERPKLLAWLEGLVSSSFSNLRIIATSRPEADIRGCVPELFGTQNCIWMDKTSVDLDIRRYITARLRSQEFRRFSSHPSTLKEINDQLGNRAQGMFRWVACQLDRLAKCLSHTAITETLRSLPKDLNETYSQILDRLHPDTRNRTMLLLQFLVYGKRPLKPAEAGDVVATRIDGQNSGFRDQDRPLRELDILEYCPSMISITNTGINVFYEAQPELVLAHFSVKEYLLERERGYMAPVMANGAITLACLAYMSSIEKQQGYGVSFTSKPIAWVPAFRFKDYAAPYWATHAAIAEDLDHVFEAVIDFILKEDTPSALFEDFSGHSMTHQDRFLHVACQSGIKRLAVYALAQGANVNKADKVYGSVLQMASAFEHQNIVELLINNGADINAQKGSAGSALRAAIKNLNVGMATFLLDRGADITNDKQKEGGSLLHEACRRGQPQMAQLLVDRGADIEAGDSDGLRSLHFAVRHGYFDIAQLLVHRRADVNARGLAGETPLCEAIAKSSLGITTLLLDNGAAVNLSTKGSGTPLHCACSGLDHTVLKIVRLLLDRGADPTAKNKHGVTPLMVAVDHWGTTEMVKLLIEKGADVSAQSRNGSTVLDFASSRRCEHNIQLLLDAGAKPALERV